MKRVAFHGQRSRGRYAPRRRPRGFKAYAVLIVAAVAGTVAGIGSTLDYSGWRASAAPAYESLVTGCEVVDGDTLKCGGERIRLVGIDAPELPGHCRPGRRCVPGDPYASSADLAAMMRSSMPIQRFGEDPYGRTIAALEGASGDMSCAQIQNGQAIYKPQWDDALHVARTCPGVIGRL